MPKAVQRRRTTPPAEHLVLFLQFLAAQKQEKDAKQTREKARDALVEWIRQKGHHKVDEEKGHLLHTLPEEIDFFGQKYSGFQHQKKSGGLLFNEDAAVALCEEKGFDLDEYTTRYPDQDKIARLFAEDRLSDEEWDSLFEQQDDTWAFLPTKA